MDASGNAELVLNEFAEAERQQNAQVVENPLMAYTTRATEVAIRNS